MNNNVGPNGLDRQHGGLNHQDQGQGGHGGGGQGKSRYVPPHLRGRGGGDVPQQKEDYSVQPPVRGMISGDS